MNSGQWLLLTEGKNGFQFSLFLRTIISSFFSESWIVLLFAVWLDQTLPQLIIQAKFPVDQMPQVMMQVWNILMVYFEVAVYRTNFALVCLECDSLNVVVYWLCLRSVGSLYKIDRRANVLLTDKSVKLCMHGRWWLCQCLMRVCNILYSVTLLFIEINKL